MNGYEMGTNLNSSDVEAQEVQSTSKTSSTYNFPSKDEEEDKFVF